MKQDRLALRLTPESENYSELYGSLCKPRLKKLLELLKLDSIYLAADGDTLERWDGTRKVPVFDFLGGYGSTILGHNHRELTALVIDSLRANLPIHAQGSIRPYSALLARKLNELAAEELAPGEDYLVHLANTGTEAIEAALKHALMEWQGRKARTLLDLERRRGKIVSQGEPHRLAAVDRALEQLRALEPVLIALEGGFHGKTAGSAAATSNPAYREMYPSFPVKTVFLPRDASDDELRAVFASHRLSVERSSFTSLVGVIFEPIQGEGGIHCLTQRFVDTLRAETAASQVPLIADEIQSGLYRTGRPFACGALGLAPDYLALGKSLGGGIAKISALLVRRSRYEEDFGLIHSSTFAEDDLSSKVALHALEILSSNGSQLLARARKFETRVRTELARIQGLFPGVISEVRGRGFFLGVEFAIDGTRAQPILAQSLADSGYLSYVFASYLLHQFQLRVGVTLSQPDTLRIEPSAWISDAAVDRLVEALEALAGHVFHHRYARLTEHLFENRREPGQDLDVASPPVFRRARDSESLTKVAFLSHIIDTEHLDRLDPTFASVARDERDRFQREAGPLMRPILMHEQAISGLGGRRILYRQYGIHLTSEFFEMHFRGGSHTAFLKVEEAARRALDDGATHVGLGQYTSIVSDNGYLLRNLDCRLTTGSSLTAAFSIAALLELLKKRGTDPRHARIGVVGVTGNICSVLARVLATQARELVVVHREPYNESARFRNEVQQIADHSGMTREQILPSNDLHDLAGCDAIVLGTNTARQILLPEHVKRDCVVLDISVPSNIHPRLLSERPDVECFQGGYARLPEGQRLVNPMVPAPNGEVFACMAETIMTGLIGTKDHFSYGPLTPGKVADALRLAREVGITLGSLKRMGAF